MTNIASGWRGAGLLPLSRKKVLRHLPTPTAQPVTPLQPEVILEAITSSPPNSTVLRAAHTAFNTSVTSGNPLDTPTRKYAEGLTKTTERLAAQVAILRKERDNQKEALSKRRKQRSGKRAAIKGHFLLTTAEILEKVEAAELETLRKKACKKLPQKCRDVLENASDRKHLRKKRVQRKATAV
ncbi:MAG: hypothetical protein M1840_002398 [Geoglossum simile]|nr:MAG: hypothetical protein M1840_002398 [Geoglossum simile]